MEVYRFIKPLRTNLNYFKEGDLIYKEPYESVSGTNNYYGFNGSYALWDRSIPEIKSYLEKAFDTDKPKEYFINKVYTQYEVDEMISKIYNK